MVMFVVFGDVLGAQVEQSLALGRAVVCDQVEMAAVLRRLRLVHLQEHQGRTGFGGSDGGEVGARVGVDGSVERRGPEGGQLGGVGAVERDVGNGEHQSSVVVIGRTGQPISVRYSV